MTGCSIFGNSGLKHPVIQLLFSETQCNDHKVLCDTEEVSGFATAIYSLEL